MTLYDGKIQGLEYSLNAGVYVRFTIKSNETGKEILYTADLRFTYDQATKLLNKFPQPTMKI